MLRPFSLGALINLGRTFESITTLKLYRAYRASSARLADFQTRQAEQLGASELLARAEEHLKNVFSLRFI